MKDFGPKRRLSRILFVIYTTASMLKKLVVNLASCLSETERYQYFQGTHVPAGMFGY